MTKTTVYFKTPRREVLCNKHYVLKRLFVCSSLPVVTNVLYSQDTLPITGLLYFWRGTFFQTLLVLFAFKTIV